MPRHRCSRTFGFRDGYLHGNLYKRPPRHENDKCTSTHLHDIYLLNSFVEMASNMRPSTRSSAKEKPTESTTASTTASATADPQIISDPTGVNTVGIFKPQPTFTRLVGAAASKVQAILNIDNESSINAWDAQEFHESCTEAFEEVHDEYIKTYNRRVCSPF